MTKHGKIALFCSRDFVLGSRAEYGGGFLWQLSDDAICLEMFWVTEDVPDLIRLHLFGDTPDSDGGAEKIFRLAIEVTAPEPLRAAEPLMLHRESPLHFGYDTIADSNNDFDFFQDEEINIEF